MTPEDLEAIRARNAAWNDPHSRAFAAQDRRDLLAEVDRLEAALEREMDAGNAALAEVDRLTAIRVVMTDDRDEWLAEMKRAEAVIEAAREVLAEVSWWDDRPHKRGVPTGEPWDDLRAALAEYDR